MGDIEERLRSLNEVPAPDLWPEIDSGRQPRPSAPERARGRLAAAAVALVLLVVVAVIASQTLPGTHPEPAGPSSSGPVSIGPIPSGNVTVSAVTPDGSAKCTAAFPSTVLKPGDPTGVQVTLENLGHVGIEYDGYRSLGDVVVKDESGGVLWDGLLSSGRILSRGGLSRLILEPGGIVRLLTADDPIRWPGPLTLSVICLVTGFDLELPPVRARVAIPGPPPDPAVALNRVLQKTGGLFDECRPTPDGSPTRGLLRAPDVSGVPPMPAVCTADIVVNPGFEVVSLSFETPPDGPPVEIPDPIYQTRLPGTGQLEVGRWVFLVTGDAVVEIVRLATVGRSRKSNAKAAYYEFRTGGWSKYDSECGGGFAGGVIWFIAACAA